VFASDSAIWIKNQIKRDGLEAERTYIEACLAELEALSE